MGETYNLVSREGVQMHGGIGMTDEFDIGFFIKRAAVAEQTFGDVNFHRNRYGELEGYGVCGTQLAIRSYRNSSKRKRARKRLFLCPKF